MSIQQNLTRYKARVKEEMPRLLEMGRELYKEAPDGAFERYAGWIRRLSGDFPAAVMVQAEEVLKQAWTANTVMNPDIESPNKRIPILSFSVPGKMNDDVKDAVCQIVYAQLAAHYPDRLILDESLPRLVVGESMRGKDEVYETSFGLALTDPTFVADFKERLIGRGRQIGPESKRIVS